VPWKRFRLRGSDVFARVDASGAFVPQPDGRVEVRYKPIATKAYHASPRNLEPSGNDAILPDEHCALDAGGSTQRAVPEGELAIAPSTPGAAHVAAKRPASAAKAHAGPLAAGTGVVEVFADGACTGNPGPSGLGVFYRDGARLVERSEYLGHGTNNIAELTAILRAIEILEDPQRHCVIRTDSQYSIGVLQKGWKAKANQSLIADIRARLAEFRHVRLEYVRGHAGIPGNERADELARRAVETRSTHQDDTSSAPKRPPRRRRSRASSADE